MNRAAVLSVTMLIGLSMLTGPGCQWAGDVDERIHEAHMGWYDATESYVALQEVLKVKATEMGEKKHSIQAKYTDEQVRNVKARYPTTMPSDVAFKLLTEVRERDADLAQSRNDWARIIAGWSQGNQRARDLVTRARADQTNWQEFKRSARASYDAALTTLTGLATGIMAGVAVD